MRPKNPIFGAAGVPTAVAGAPIAGTPGTIPFIILIASLTPCPACPPCVLVLFLRVRVRLCLGLFLVYVLGIIPST